MIDNQLLLKAIYELGGSQQDVHTGALAHRFMIKPASISERIQRLSKAGMLTYKPYYGVKLTKDGLKYAILSIREHRLLELYLQQQFNYSSLDAYNLATKLSRFPDSKFIDKLAMVLDNPTVCPHGGPIPAADGHIKKLRKRPLNTVTTHQWLTVIQITDDSDLIAITQSMQLTIGDEIRINRRNDFDRTLIVEKLSNNQVQPLVLSEQSAAFIYVHNSR